MDLDDEELKATRKLNGANKESNIEEDINWIGIYNQLAIAHLIEKIKDNETFWKDTKFIGVTNRKLPAQLYIADRAYKYTGQTVKQFMLDNSEELGGGEER